MQIEFVRAVKLNLIGAGLLALYNLSTTYSKFQETVRKPSNFFSTVKAAPKLSHPGPLLWVCIQNRISRDSAKTPPRT